MTFFNKKNKNVAFFFAVCFCLSIFAMLKAFKTIFVNNLINNYYEQNRFSKRYC